MQRIWNTIKGIQALGNLKTDDLLNYVGLEKRRSATDRVLPMAGAFGAGMLVGAGLGILFAPMSGEETRKLILDRAVEINRALRSRFSKDKGRAETNAGSRDETTGAQA